MASEPEPSSQTWRDDAIDDLRRALPEIDDGELTESRQGEDPPEEEHQPLHDPLWAPL